MSEQTEIEEWEETGVNSKMNENLNQLKHKNGTNKPPLLNETSNTNDNKFIYVNNN